MLSLKMVLYAHGRSRSRGIRQSGRSGKACRSSHHQYAQAHQSMSCNAYPPGMVHYVYAEGETVVQLNSSGPWTITYVDEDDDPRM